jgi:hypothetical protein
LSCTIDKVAKVRKTKTMTMAASLRALLIHRNSVSRSAPVRVKGHAFSGAISRILTSLLDLTVKIFN